MIDQVSQKQIISLWVGKQSQQCAFNFYNLQAQQIFNQQQDPIIHSTLWKNMKKLQPRMLIFDTQIDRLSAVRQVNNKKILQKMKKQQNWNSLMGMFSQIDTTPLQKHDNNEQNTQNQWPQMSNWTDKQQNYYIIDQGYTSIPKNIKQNPDTQAQQFAIHQQFYRINKDQTENRLRKQLQNTDFLKLFTLCTDQNNSGYTNKIVQYLRQQCPKKCYLLTSLTQSNNMPVISLSKLYHQVDIFLPINININNIKHQYFRNSTINKTLAPYFSSLYTPFVMKQVDPYHYISTIVTDNRKLFNTAFTLPVIDQQLNLKQNTNIFRYLQAMQKDDKDNKKNKQEKQKQKYMGNKDKQMKNKLDKNTKQSTPNKTKQKQQQLQQKQQQQIRINFSNQSYLSLKNKNYKGKFLSQSFILKGHFNNLQKIFQPKTQPSALSIKYLKGIFSSPQNPQTYYDKFYQNQYGDKVQAYPYQLIMFSHQYFGQSMRKQLKTMQKNKIFNQQWPQAKQQLFHIADTYMEVHEESD